MKACTFDMHGIWSYGVIFIPTTFPHICMHDFLRVQMSGVLGKKKLRLANNTHYTQKGSTRAARLPEWRHPRYTNII